MHVTMYFMAVRLSQ